MVSHARLALCLLCLAATVHAQEAFELQDPPSVLCGYPSARASALAFLGKPCVLSNQQGQFTLAARPYGYAVLCTVARGGIRTFHQIVDPGGALPPLSCPEIPPTFADVAGAPARSMSARIDTIVRLSQAFEAELRAADGRSHLDIIEFEVHNNRGQLGRVSTQLDRVLATLRTLADPVSHTALLAEHTQTQDTLATVLDRQGTLNTRAERALTTAVRHHQAAGQRHQRLSEQVDGALTTVLEAINATAGVDVSGVIRAIDQVRTVLNRTRANTSLRDILAALHQAIGPAGSATESLDAIEAVLVGIRQILDTDGSGRDIVGVLRQSKTVLEAIRASGASSEAQLGAIVHGIDGGNATLASVLDALTGLNGAGAECPLTHEYTPGQGEAASRCVQRCPAPLVFEANARWIDTTVLTCTAPDANGRCANPTYAPTSPWLDVTITEVPYSQGSTRAGLGCYSLAHRAPAPLTVADFEVYDEDALPASYDDLAARDNPLPQLTQRLVLPSGTTEGWLTTAQACPDPSGAFGIPPEAPTYAFFARFLSDYWCAYLPTLGNILFTVALIFSSVYFFRSV